MSDRPTAESPALNKAARALSKMRLAEGYRYDWFLNSILEVQAEAAALSDSALREALYPTRRVVYKDGITADIQHSYPPSTSHRESFTDCETCKARALLAQPTQADKPSLDAEQPWRDALEQTTEALIVARRWSPTKTEPDPFAYDKRLLTFHGNEAHADGMQCEVCDYNNAFDALIETNRALLDTPEGSEPR